MVDKKTETKMFSVADFAKKLNKEYKDDTLLRKSDIIPQYRRLKTGALGLDFTLYGGFPYGRIGQLSGMYHSGKTLASTLCIAAYQKENPHQTCVYVDAEHALDLQFNVLMNHVDQDKLFIFTPPVGMSGEQILGAVLELQTTVDDIGLIVIDSVPALVTSANLKSDFEDDKGMRGTIAKYMHKFCSEVTPSIQAKNNMILFINQSRIKGYNSFRGQQFPVYGEYGGDALGFYSSVSIRFGTRKFMKDGELLTGIKGDGADGFRLVFSVTKNKTAATNRGGGFITYNYETGIDIIGDALAIAFTYDFLKQASSRTYFLSDPLTGEIYVDENGKEIRGYEKDIKEYLLNHEDVCTKFVNNLLEAISASNTIKSLLSEEDLAQINAEEEMVVKDAKAAV